jgi:hypothetical protein
MAITKIRFSRAYWLCFKLLNGSAGIAGFTWSRVIALKA